MVNSMMRNKFPFCCLFISLLLVQSGIAQQPDMVTIIGPDGRPMIVPRPIEAMPKAKEEKKAKEDKVDQDASKEGFFSFFKSKKEKTEVKVIPNNEKVLLPESNISTTLVTTVIEKPLVESKAVKVQMPDPAPAQKMQSDSNTSQQVKIISNPDESHVVNTVPPSKQEASDLPYHIIDGEKYYESEYLESKEFNLDNKKRFYQIPNVAGGASWDVLEREKGADMSLFQSDVKTQKIANIPVALGVNYKVLSKDELSQALPIQCVDQKAQTKSKKLLINRPLSLWPRAPFHDQFDYQLVALEEGIQNFKITSYGSHVDHPSYYWPMAIFLDRNGCLIEGASAFFSTAYPSTMLQNESIEGIIHVPNESKFVLLTALEQAVDVPTLTLSNQGQIKLTVLK